MSEFSLQIIEQGKVSPCFIKASSALLKKHQENFLNSTDKESKFCSLWLEEYKGSLVKTDRMFEKIVFTTSHDLTIFLLRFN